MSLEQAQIDTWADAATAEVQDASTREDRCCDAEGARYGVREPVDDSQETPERERPEELCQNCGRDVIDRLRRVFGDNNDVLWHCQDCLDDQSSLSLGAGAVPEWNADAKALTAQSEARGSGGGI